jgi:hypothetical protein
VLDDEDAPVGTLVLDAAEAPDRAWLAVELEPQPRSKGRCYTVEITACGTGPRNALSFGLSSTTATSGRAWLDGVELSGGLALRSFAAWEHALGGEAVVPTERRSEALAQSR